MGSTFMKSVYVSLPVITIMLPGLMEPPTLRICDVQTARRGRHDGPQPGSARVGRRRPFLPPARLARVLVLRDAPDEPPRVYLQHDPRPPPQEQGPGLHG